MTASYTPLLHRSVSVVHGDPLGSGKAEADLLPGPLVIKHVIRLTHALLANLDALDEDGSLGRRATQGLKQAHERLVFGLLVELEVYNRLGELHVEENMGQNN